MANYRGGAPIVARYHGATPILKVYRGSTLVWSRTAISDGFDLDGWLQGWINELCTDPGGLFADPFGRLGDGLNTVIGQTVDYVNNGVNGVGTLVGQGGSTLVDAYCAAWGGTSAPDGLVGLVNGIPIIGGFLGDWLQGDLEITSLLGSVPVVGDIARQIGLLPDAISGTLGDTFNYVVDEAGNVIGKLTCGVYKDIGATLGEGVCYVISVLGGAARMTIPDGLMNLNQQFSRFRHPTILTGDDGWLETQIAELGTPGYATNLFRRYQNNGSGQTGVGMNFVDSVASIVRKVGGTDVLVAPGLASYKPGDVFRLGQLGDTHALIKNGQAVGQPWVDNGNTAALGANNRSVAMIMSGAKELLGTRRYSPSLAYVQAA